MGVSIAKANQLFVEKKYVDALLEYSNTLKYYEKFSDIIVPQSLILHCKFRIEVIKNKLSVGPLSEVNKKHVPPSVFKACVFADSRALFKEPHANYKLFTEELTQKWDVDLYIQPYKWTTVVDFLGLILDGVINPNDYDLVILYAGIVDFSPRPIKGLKNGLLINKDTNLMHISAGKVYQYQRKLNNKINYLNDLGFNMEQLKPHYSLGFDVIYEGDRTCNLLPSSQMEKLANILNIIPNLLFIDCCKVLPNWNGSYKRGRPSNINLVYENSIKLSPLMNNAIRISDWTEKNIREFTSDNMHLTKNGSDKLLQNILNSPAYEQAQKYRAKKITKNVIITASDKSFFSSLIMMIESLLKYNFGVLDEILIFDLGLEDWQKNYVESIRYTKLFTYFPEDILELKQLDFNFFNPKTYAFKVYALTQFHKLYDRNNIEINCMYVDAGIIFQRPYKEIFDIIDKEDIFCVDHNDCHEYYGDNAFMLLHILSPDLYQDNNGTSLDILDVSKLAKPYIKAGFFGYKVNGKYQSMVDEHYTLCKKTTVLSESRNISGNSRADRLKIMWYRNNTNIGQYLTVNNIPFGSLNYQNGRHDQTILSYLVIKNNVHIRNSRLYNFTASGSVSKTQWFSSFKDKISKKFHLFENDISKIINIKDDAYLNNVNNIVQKYIEIKWKEKEKRDTKAIAFPKTRESQDSISILHRGSLSKKDQWKCQGRLINYKKNKNDNDIFILLGNGPSLGDVDLHSLERYSTFGLNAAYRAYSEIDFWPTYFGCFDSLVCGHHASEFKKLILDSPISRFFFINFDDKKRENFPELEIQNHPKFERISFISRTPEEKEKNNLIATSFNPFLDMLTSGSNSVQCALLMGYRKIILLGCDANYVEVVDGAQQESNKNKLIMNETPDANPNYWFSNYQQKGDRFNLPNLAGCQLPAWGRLAETIKHLGINAEIINCSPDSRIEDFKKMDLQNTLKYFK